MGKVLPLGKVTEAHANYLAEEQWGPSKASPLPPADPNPKPIHSTNLNLSTEGFTIE